MRRLEGRIAIVTGGGQGIGEGLCRRLAAEGCSVVVADVNGANAEKTAASLRDAGAEAVGFEANVADAASVSALFDAVKERRGRLDLLVNNAGLIRPKFVTDVTEADWDATLAVNLKGTFLCSQAAARIMIEQRSGAIVNMSSKSGKKGGQWLAAYCASKFGIIGLTQSMAMDLAAFKVRVNAVCPGNVMTTPMWETLFEPYAAKLGIPVEKVRDHYNEKVPLGRECTAEDIANVVVFLAGDESSYMTGQAINVTGGQEMG
jgi:sorbitol-6-phosphate 2-dehydrogenase